MKKRVIVVGGGPGGYVAAIRAAQLGAEVHLIEREKVGGTCLNVGCIPTKTLLHSAEIYKAVSRGKVAGIKGGELDLDLSELMLHKQKVVSHLVNGVEGLLKANKVAVYAGSAILSENKTVLVNGKTLAGDVIILATGSEAVRLSFTGADLPEVIDSSAALSLPKVPASLVIVGGGVIGVEFAALYAALGSQVTVVEMQPEILPGTDGEIAAMVRQTLGQDGITVFTQTELAEVVKGTEGVKAIVRKDGKTWDIVAEHVLIAVGRKSCVQGLGLEKAGVTVARGRIKTDEFFASSVPGIYAIGDCNGQMMLAHAASAQGAAAVEHALGHRPQYLKHIVPACIYTSPEVASVGLSEEAARQQGVSFRVGKFPLAGNGKAVIESEGAGLIKILAGSKYGEILGVHILGPRATDLIAEAALAIRLEATVDELVSTIHAHPTVSEAMGEAALAVNNAAIHWPPVRS